MDASISHWITRLKSGDAAAARPLWDTYFSRLVRYARTRLPGDPAIDPDGVAASAFHSFWRAAAGGAFARLDDRGDVWFLLTLITRRKIARLLERRNAAIRGGGRQPESVLSADDFPDPAADPQFPALWADEFRRILDSLADPALQTILLRKLDDVPHQAIGAEIGCTVRTVSNKLRLIQRHLRLYLDSAEVS
jgi:DNA-directed RNA polymerase specialized sigma24 family protein